MMTKLARCLVAALLLAPAAARADDKPAPRKDRPVDKIQQDTPKMRKFDPPQATKVDLKNGIVCYILEDHDVPLVQLHGVLRAGSAWDPEDKLGLASIAGEVWRTGGTKTHPEEKLDELLERHGATLETGVGFEQGSIRLSVLKEDVDLGLSLVKELLTEPLFPKKKLDQAKRSRLLQVKQRNDQAPGIAERVFAMTIFGKTSPLAREIDRSTIDAIKVEDLAEWHKKFVRPGGLLLGGYGDLDLAGFQQKLDASLGTWSAGEGAAAPELPLVDATRKASWTVAAKPDVNQSTIVIGHVGGVRTPKNFDEYAQLVCMDQILGGNGFSSRLMMHVRTEKGLAYDVHSTLGMDYAHPGTFQLYCGTKSESTVEAIKTMLDEVEKIRTEVPTDDELAVAKESLLNSVPSWVDTTDKVMDRTLRYHYYGFPQDSLQKFLDAFSKVTKEQVLEAAKKFIHPEAFTLVVCGDPAHFDQGGIPSIAKEKVVEIEDAEAWAHPGSKEKGAGDKPAADKPAADGAEVAKILARLVETAGGKKALTDLQTVRVTSKITLQQGPQSVQIGVELVAQFPDKFRQNLTLPGGQKQSYIIDGAKGWVTPPDGKTKALEAGDVAKSRERFGGDPLVILKSAAMGDLVASLDGEDKMGEKAVLKLSVKRKDAKTSTVILVDKETGALAGRIADFMGAPVRYTYSDWKEFGGIKFPTKAEGRAEEDPEGEAALKIAFEGEANPKLDEKTFSAPSEEK